jgi:23S rRNA pseudouridine1911/1915/1917 synthase
VNALRVFRRQALHAERLSFEHPASGELLSFLAARPADMDELIAALRTDLATHERG